MSFGHFISSAAVALGAVQAAKAADLIEDLERLPAAGVERLLHLACCGGLSPAQRMRTVEANVS